MSIIIEILLTLLYLAIFIFVLLKWSFFKDEHIHKHTLPVVLIIKVVLGTLLALIYTYYYPDRLKADVFKYFDDSKIMFDALLHKPTDYFKMLFGFDNNSVYFDTYYNLMNNWYRQYESNIYNDSHIIIRFNALVRLFSFGFFSVHTVFMSFIALTGQMAIFKFIKRNADLKPFMIFIAVFLLPSVLFWSSGVLKEGLLFFGFGFFVYHAYKIIQRFSYKSLFWIVFSLILLAYLKFYIIASLLPLLLTYFWCVKTNNRLFLLKYLFAIAMILVVGFNFHHIFPEYNLIQIMVNKQNDFFYLALDQNSGSLFYVEKLKPTFISFLVNTPKAVFNVFFMPHIFMKQSVLSLFSALENFIFIILLIITIFNFKTNLKPNSFFIFCLVFTLFTFALIGLTTPVYGAIVRYKIPALPFLTVLIFLCLDFEMLHNKFLKIKNIFHNEK